MVIGEYFVIGYQWLSMIIILMGIGEYSIGGYCDYQCYYIIGYWWVLY